MRFFNSRRGYVRVTVDRERWTSGFRVLPYVTKPDAPISTRASVVEEEDGGVPGVQI